MSDYKYISKEFKHEGHYWKATDEVCTQGRDYVCIRRTGFASELSKLQSNVGITTKCAIRKTKIADKLI